jgi:hypothetical protein
MKYIVGTTNREYFLFGKLFPKSDYTEAEYQKGKKQVCEVEDKELESMEKVNTFNDLVNGGILKVLDERPEGGYSPSEDVERSKQYARELEIKLQEALAERTAVEEEAKKLIAERDAKIAELEG